MESSLRRRLMKAFPAAALAVCAVGSSSISEPKTPAFVAPLAPILAQAPAATSTPIEVTLVKFRKSSGLGPRVVFGEPEDHQGIDYFAPEGTPVPAAESGTVEKIGHEVDKAGNYKGCGLYVDIRHPNGFMTRYCHLKELGPGIEQGTFVNWFQTLAYVGTTGRVTGPNVHFVLFDEKGNVLDPEKYLHGHYTEVFHAGQMVAKADLGPGLRPHTKLVDWSQVAAAPAPVSASIFSPIVPSVASESAAESQHMSETGGKIASVMVLSGLGLGGGLVALNWPWRRRDSDGASNQRRASRRKTSRGVTRRTPYVSTVASPTASPAKMASSGEQTPATAPISRTGVPDWYEVNTKPFPIPSTPVPMAPASPGDTILPRAQNKLTANAAAVSKPPVGPSPAPPPAPVSSPVEEAIKVQEAAAPDSRSRPIHPWKKALTQLTPEERKAFIEHYGCKAGLAIEDGGARFKVPHGAFSYVTVETKRVGLAAAKSDESIEGALRYAVDAWGGCQLKDASEAYRADVMRVAAQIGLIVDVTGTIRAPAGPNRKQVGRRPTTRDLGP